MKTYMLEDSEIEYLKTRQNTIDLFLTAVRDANTAAAVFIRTTIFNRLKIDPSKEVETNYDLKRGILMITEKKEKEGGQAKPKKQSKK